MEFNEDSIKEFQALYEKHFGEAISPQEADLMLGRLVRLYRLIARPLPRKDGQD